eukprot:2896397-Amphidinium_carterae.3
MTIERVPEHATSTRRFSRHCTFWPPHVLRAELSIPTQRFKSQCQNPGRVFQLTRTLATWA